MKVWFSLVKIFLVAFDLGNIDFIPYFTDTLYIVKHWRTYDPWLMSLFFHYSSNYFSLLHCLLLPAYSRSSSTPICNHSYIHTSLIMAPGTAKRRSRCVLVITNLFSATVAHSRPLCLRSLNCPVSLFIVKV